MRAQIVPTYSLSNLHLSDDAKEYLESKNCPLDVQKTVDGHYIVNLPLDVLPKNLPGCLYDCVCWVRALKEHSYNLVAIHFQPGGDEILSLHFYLPKKQFKVVLSGTAHMQQTHYINAASKQEATRIALDRMHNHTWNYAGLCDDNVEVEVY